MLKPVRGTLLNHSHPLNRGLVGCWLFNELSGNIANDISGSKNHGALVNGPTWEPSKFGGSVGFDAADDRIEIQKITIAANYSIVFWVYLETIPGTRRIIAGDIAATNNFFAAMYTGDVQLRDLGYNTVTWTTSFPLKKWTHVAVIRNAIDWELFIDGVSLGALSATSDLEITEIGSGYSGTTYVWDGSIDETRIYNRLLTPREIRLLLQRPPDLYEIDSNGFLFRIISTIPISTTGDFIMISVKRMTLLDSVSSDMNGPARFWDGIGPGSLHVFGTWDGATVTIQGSLDGGVTWTALSSLTLTANTFISFEMGLAHIRAVVSSAGASTELSAYVAPQERS